MLARPSDRTLGERRDRSARVQPARRPSLTHASAEHILEVLGESCLLARLLQVGPFGTQEQSLLAAHPLCIALGSGRVVFGAGLAVIVRFTCAQDWCWRWVKAPRLGGGAEAALSRAAHARRAGHGRGT